MPAGAAASGRAGASQDRRIRRLGNDEQRQEKEAEAIPEGISDEDMVGRRDFRDTITFTIDPADAKDFDDAISFKKLPNGNYEIGVHIADVSHYVKPNSNLDKEAYTTTVAKVIKSYVVLRLLEELLLAPE